MSSSNMFVDATSDAVDHCETMAKLYADLADDYEKIRSLVSDKLWHQLTLALLAFVSTPDRTLRSTAEGTNSYLALYDKVVLAVNKKLNPLELARIASHVAFSISTQDGTAAKAVLENLLQDKKQLGPAATLYTESKLSLLTLRLMETSNSTDAEVLQQIKSSIQSNSKTLKELQDPSQDTRIVHSAHYESAMVYYKAVGPPEAYYHEALSYLNYTSLDSLSSQERFQLATNLSLAALTGEGVFNFGQVVTTPILAELENTPSAWLMELMHASAKGDVLQFQAITEKHASEVAQQPALANRASFLREKITLLALVNMVFERASADRTLTFQDVADRIHMPKDQVELVIMRALSLGLIQGSMDQVDETVQVTWVMPRVLDNSQLSSLSTRFGEWAVKVSQTRDYMGQQTPMLA